jgi:hypothetical protein
MALPSASPEVVRELFTRFAAGEKLTDIRRDLSLPRTTAQHLLRRQYAREIVGDELFQRVQATLDDPERMDQVRDAQAAVHLLGRCVHCSICGRLAWIDSRRDIGLRISCRQKGDHSVSTRLEFAEKVVEDFVLAHATDPRFGELAQEADPVRAWNEDYTLARKRDVIRGALRLELRRSKPGRGYDPHAIKITWKNEENASVPPPVLN